jgi:methanogen homoaconitase large subunit
VGVANSQNTVRSFAREEGIRLFDVGRGICHQVLIEEQIAHPGRIVLGSDSHSTSYGAVGAFGSGMGSTDIALIWGTGHTWLKVPETIQVVINGRFRTGVTAKDLALKLEQELTIAGATYASVEYHGLEWMSLSERQTLASMAVELGAKAGIIPPSGEVLDRFEIPEWLYVDPLASYDQTYQIDLAHLEPQIAAPHAVDNVTDISALAGTPVDVVFLGTCTNGRYEDMKTAAELLKGRFVSETVRFLVTPASKQELQRAITDGTLATLLEAGAILTTPGCGTCMGRHQGTLGDHDVCLSTGNRNFKGRMGAPTSKIYLGSPAVAAATAITGKISDPREL